MEIIFCQLSDMAAMSNWIVPPHQAQAFFACVSFDILELSVSICFCFQLKEPMQIYAVQSCEHALIIMMYLFVQEPLLPPPLLDLIMLDPDC